LSRRRRVFSSNARQTHTGKKEMKEEKNTHKKSWAKKEEGRIGNEKKNKR
jgi:hypothetical protein